MTIRRFIVLTTFAIGLAVATVIVFQSLLSERVEVNASAWSAFFGLNGFFFAILIGLLIAELLRRFHRLNAVVRMEATALGQVNRALIFQKGDESVESAIREDVQRYAAAVLAKEWPDMAAKRRVHGEGGAMGELYSVLNDIRDLEMRGDMDVIARRMLIDGVIDVTSLRSERLHLSAEHLSPVIRGVVVFLSLVIVFSFAFVNVGAFIFHVLMVVLLGIAVALLILGLADLSQPFEGLWNVSAEPFREVAGEAETEAPRS